MIIVNSNCPANHRCPLIKKCPAEAIRQEGVGAPVIDQEKCLECGLCVEECPMAAVEMIPA